MASQDKSIIALAETILKQTKGIANFLKDNNLAEPTFSIESSQPPSAPAFVELQGKLKTSLEDLQRLVEGPRRFLRSFCVLGYDLAAFQIALDFNFFTLVPADGEISLEDLSKLAGLDLDRVSRVVRMLATYRFFEEHKPGVIRHSSSSIVLLQDEELRCTVHYSLDEMLKAAAESNVALKADPYEADSNHCPFKARHGLPIFEFYGKNPAYAGRFARAMAGATRMDRRIDELRDSFPWADLNGTVVDIGGGSGHISMTLARMFPNLQFVVQDRGADMLAEGKALLTDEIRDRISFMQHSFFEPQPYMGAAAYLIRQCTHNWCDRDVVTMFKSVVPALEGSAPGTPLLINDIVMPEPGEWDRGEERAVRQIDMIMLVSFGAKQRTKVEFETLLKEADPRYQLRSVRAMGPLGLLEVYLDH